VPAKIIKVKVITKARFNKVKIEGQRLKVYTTAAPDKKSQQVSYSIAIPIFR
jgi:hypothetical protein